MSNILTEGSKIGSMSPKDNMNNSKRPPPPKPPYPRHIKEGLNPDCPKCGSSTESIFGFFKKCIHPKCDYGKD